MQDFSCLLLAFTARLPEPEKMSWASEKKTALRSSSPVAEYAADAPSAREFVPSTKTNVRFLLWLFMAAPDGLVMETPLRRIACFFSLYSLKLPSEVLPVSL